MTEHVLDWDKGTLDETAEPVYKETPGAPLDETRIATMKYESNNEVDQEKNQAQPDKQSNSDQADQREHSDSSQSDLNASSGNEAGDADEGESSSPDEMDSDAQDGAGDGKDANKKSDSGKNDSDGGKNAGGENADGGSGGEGKVYAEGEYDDMPEDVDGVAATGQYALIVQMLAGKGGLVASDAAWLKNTKSSKAFSSEGLEKVAAAWSGDGTAEGSLNVKKLIEAGPDVIISDGYEPAISKSDLKKITKAGISVVTVPKLGGVDTPDNDILTTVKVVGELLKNGDTAYDASKMSAAYKKMHNDVIQESVRVNGGYSYKLVNGTPYSWIYQGTDTRGTSTSKISDNRSITSFIDSWTTHTVASIRAVRQNSFNSLYLHDELIDLSGGVGLSAQANSKNHILLDYYLQTAGVVNNAYDTAKPVSSSKDALGYVVVPGASDGMTTVKVSQRNRPSALWFYPVDVSAWKLVGDADYPALLTRDSDIATKVVNSAKKRNGVYNTGTPYEVWVLPQGLAGSWADGTVESFLSSPWSYCMFRQEQDLEYFWANANSYAQTFYRTSAEEVIEDAHTVKKAQCPTG